MCATDDLCSSDEAYLICIGEVRQDLITSTAAISAISTFLMGLFANLPVGLAPGLGLNAYVRCVFYIFRFEYSRSLLSSLTLWSATTEAVVSAIARRLRQSFWKGGRLFFACLSFLVY